MRRPMMSLICLIAALAGTPLRLAEAADDLARSLAECGCGCGQMVEARDGGVGDDSGVTVLKAGTATQLAPSVMRPEAVAGLLPPLSPASSPSVPDGRRRADRTAMLPAGSLRRQAWLQCFLF